MAQYRKTRPVKLNAYSKPYISKNCSKGDLLMQKKRMLSLVCALVGVLFLSLIPESALAEVKPKITWEYYAVDIEGDGDILERLLEKAPVHSSGRKAFGLTAWTIAYDGNFNEKNKRCEIRTLDVSCSCKITLPKFRGRNPALRDKLQGFLHVIRKHELEHCNIAVQHAEALERRLLALGQYKCEDLERRVQNLYSDTMDAAEMAQDDFDLETENGMDSDFLENYFGSDAKEESDW